MKSSNGSTSRLAFLLAGLVLVGLTPILAVLTGCGVQTRTAVPLPLRGYVRLDVLMRSHPGWSGLAQYDQASQRLQGAVESLPPADKPNEKIATLPALTAGLGAGSEVIHGEDVAEAGKHLTEIQASLLAGLRSRREMARLDQLRGQRDIWRREARQRYPVPDQTSAIRPDLELQLLQANVETLTRTLNNWKSSVPPAPKREALRRKVEDDRTRLTALIAERTQVREAVQVQYLADVQRARDQRTAYVRTESDALEARLLAVDNRVIAAQEGRLARQRAALLASLAQSSSVVVPLAGSAGAQALPKGRGAGQAALSRASLQEAQTRLAAQKSRWIKYLGDDTQATARDVAEQKHWDVTFGLPRPGDQDLTQPLAKAMASGVWRPG